MHFIREGWSIGHPNGRNVPNLSLNLNSSIGKNASSVEAFHTAFLKEVSTIVRAHVVALGGNGVVCLKLHAQESGGREFGKQVFNMLLVTGDVVVIETDTQRAMGLIKSHSDIQLGLLGLMGESDSSGAGASPITLSRVASRERGRDRGRDGEE